MFLRKYCIYNLHKIISHYLFHLPLCWKRQLKENKLGRAYLVCLKVHYQGLLQLVQSIVSVQCWLFVTWCDVLKYKPKCNSCYLPQQTYYPLFCLPLPPSHKTYLSWLHSYSLHYSSTLVQSCSVSNHFICSVYIVSY